MAADDHDQWERAYKALQMESHYTGDRTTKANADGEYYAIKHDTKQAVFVDKDGNRSVVAKWDDDLSVDALKTIGRHLQKSGFKPGSTSPEPPSDFSSGWAAQDRAKREREKPPPPSPKEPELKKERKTYKPGSERDTKAPAKMPALTDLERKVLKALHKSSDDNGHDFAIVEEARGAVGSAKELSGIMSSLSKKGYIQTWGKLGKGGSGVQQVVLQHAKDGEWVHGPDAAEHIERALKSGFEKFVRGAGKRGDEEKTLARLQQARTIKTGAKGGRYIEFPGGARKYLKD